MTTIRRNQVSEAFDGVATMALFASPAGTLTWALEGDGKSARVIEVGKSTVPPTSTVSAAKEILDTVSPGLSQDFETQFIKAVRAHAQVSINEELWRQISSATASP